MDDLNMYSITETQDSDDGSIDLNQSVIDVSDIVEILTSLQLSVIPQNYVDKVMNSHYNYNEFPESYESVVMTDIQFPSIMNESCELLNMYLQQSLSMHIVWDQFINDATCSVHPKPLSCLLNCYIQNGIENINEPSARKNGLSATRFFFLASTFKGSKNIGFYHICILTKCSEFIKNCIELLNVAKSNNQEVKLQEDEKNDLIVDLSAIVQDLAIMVKRFQFFDEINSLDLIIDMLIDMTRLERVSGNIFEQVPTEKLSFSAVAFHAYSCLTDMFNDNCGSTLIISQKIMRYLVLGLLVDEQREMQLSTKQFNAIRDHHLSFIRKLTVKLGTPFQSILEILIQHLLHRGPDRSELKPRQIQILMEVWRLCSNEVRIKLKYYFLRMVYDVDVKIRTATLEILYKILSEPEESEPEDPKLLQLMPATKHEFIVAVILSKFQDILLTVRAKAFSLFSNLTAGPPIASAHHTALVKRVLVDPYINVDNLNQTSFSKRDFHEFYQYLHNDLANFNINRISNYKIYPGAKILLWVLNVHARDQRAHIRRISLTLLCNLFLVNNKFMEKYYLSLLLNSCSDCSVTIRKVAISGLTNLILKYPDDQDVLKYWFKGLILLVGDRDKRIQDLVIERMHQVILKNIKPYSSKLIDDNNSLDYLPWRVLDVALNDNVGKYMMCLCEMWHTHGFLTDGIVEDLITYVGTSNHNWTIHSLFLLQLISHRLTIKNISPIIMYFETHFDSWFSNEDPIILNTLLTKAQIVLDILFLNYECFDVETREQMLNKFECLLFDFKIPTRLISKSLDLYTVLLSDNPNKRDMNLIKLFKNIYNFLENPTNMENEEIMIRHIYTLGDISLIQHLKIKRKFQEFLLGFLSKTDQSVSSAFQTVAALTIGKLSIVDEQLAKEAIVQFGAILKNPYHPSIKINALTALSDLCLRCTTLVEQAIPEMCVCLKSESLTVKRVALKLLTDLILEDYIKLRDVAFFALLCMLEDSDAYVRQETSSFIVNYLLIKNKNIMERKLIEVIFHFNGYTGGQSSVKDCFTNPDLKAFFSMEGDSKKLSRHGVYRFMLTHMMDDNKLKLMVKMFKVFGDIVKDVKTTSNKENREHAIQVMRDALWILRAKEMALTSGNPRDSNNDDDPETLERVADIAKKKLVLGTYKAVLTDYVVPSALTLKVELEKNKKVLSPVLNDLRIFLCTLTMTNTSIKNDIVEAISVDSEFITEIIHMCRLMKQQKQQRRGENGPGECESEDDDNDDDYDEEMHFIQDLEYVTWAQIMEMRDQAEESGLDELTQVQLQKELQLKAFDIFIADNDLNNEAAANFSQLTGEEIIVRDIQNISKSSKTNKIATQHPSPSEVSRSDVTDLDQSDLPAYKLFD